MNPQAQRTAPTQHSASTESPVRILAASEKGRRAIPYRGTAKSVNSAAANRMA
jgi:hypothetical protein